MADFDINPIAVADPVAPTPPGKVEVEGPVQYKDKSPEEINAIVKAESEEKAQLARQLQEQNEKYNKLAMAALSMNQNTITPPAAPKPNIPDAEEDPTGHQAALISQAVELAFENKVKPLAQQFEQSQLLALQGAIETNKMKMAADPKFPYWKDVEEEIMQVLAQYGPQMAAQPNALQEMYWRTVGKHVADGDQKFLTTPAVGSPPLESGGRGSNTMHDRDLPSGGGGSLRLSDAGRSFAARSKMGEGEFKGYQGGGTMSLEEHQAIQEKLKKRAS